MPLSIAELKRSLGIVEENDFIAPLTVEVGPAISLASVVKSDIDDATKKDSNETKTKLVPSEVCDSNGIPEHSPENELSVEIKSQLPNIKSDLENPTNGNTDNEINAGLSENNSEKVETIPSARDENDDINSTSCANINNNETKNELKDENDEEELSSVKENVPPKDTDESGVNDNEKQAIPSTPSDALVNKEGDEVRVKIDEKLDLSESSEGVRDSLSTKNISGDVDTNISENLNASDTPKGQNIPLEENVCDTENVGNALDTDDGLKEVEDIPLSENGNDARNATNIETLNAEDDNIVVVSDSSDAPEVVTTEKLVANEAPEEGKDILISENDSNKRSVDIPVTTDAINAPEDVITVTKDVKEAVDQVNTETLDEENAPEEVKDISLSVSDRGDGNVDIPETLDGSNAPEEMIAATDEEKYTAEEVITKSMDMNSVSKEVKDIPLSERNSGDGNLDIPDTVDTIKAPEQVITSTVEKKDAMEEVITETLDVDNSPEEVNDTPLSENNSDNVNVDIPETVDASNTPEEVVTAPEEEKNTPTLENNGGDVNIDISETEDAINVPEEKRVTVTDDKKDAMEEEITETLDVDNSPEEVKDIPLLNDNNAGVNVDIPEIVDAINAPKEVVAVTSDETDPADEVITETLDVDNAPENVKDLAISESNSGAVDSDIPETMDAINAPEGVTTVTTDEKVAAEEVISETLDADNASEEGRDNPLSENNSGDGHFDIPETSPEEVITVPTDEKHAVEEVITETLVVDDTSEEENDIPLSENNSGDGNVDTPETVNAINSQEEVTTVPTDEMDAVQGVITETLVVDNASEEVNDIPLSENNSGDGNVDTPETVNAINSPEEETTVPTDEMDAVQGVITETLVVDNASEEVKDIPLSENNSGDENVVIPETVNAINSPEELVAVTADEKDPVEDGITEILNTDNNPEEEKETPSSENYCGDGNVEIPGTVDVNNAPEEGTSETLDTYVTPDEVTDIAGTKNDECDDEMGEITATLSTDDALVKEDIDTLDAAKDVHVEEEDIPVTDDKSDKENAEITETLCNDNVSVHIHDIPSIKNNNKYEIVEITDDGTVEIPNNEDNSEVNTNKMTNADSAESELPSGLNYEKPDKLDESEEITSKTNDLDVSAHSIKEDNDNLIVERNLATENIVVTNEEEAGVLKLFETMINDNDTHIELEVMEEVKEIPVIKEDETDLKSSTNIPPIIEKGDGVSVDICLHDEANSIHPTEEELKNTDVDIEEAMKNTGSCGRFQYIVQLIMTYLIITFAYQATFSYFIAYDPPWKCTESKLPSPFCVDNAQKEIASDNKNFTQRCKMKRDEWTYTTAKDISFVTEFDLVCGEKRSIAAFASAIYHLGGGIGILVAGISADRFGRKYVLILALSVLTAISIGGSYATDTVQITIFRGFVGAGTVTCYNVCYTYLSELVSPNRRTVAAIIYGIGFVVSHGLVDVAAYHCRAWRNLQRYASLPAILGIFLLCLLPESPRWQVVKHKSSQAETTMRRIGKFNGYPAPTLTLKIPQTERNNHYTYLDLLRNLKVAAVTILQAFIWFTVEMCYYTIALESSNLGGDMYQAFGLSLIAEVPSKCVACYTCIRFGRKKSATISLMFTGVFLIATLFIPHTLSARYMLNIVLMMFAKFFADLAEQSIYMWTFELFPTVLRLQGTAVCIICARIGAFAAPFLTTVLQQKYAYLPYIILAVFAFSAAGGSLVLPETNKTPLRENYEDFFKTPRQSNALNEDKDGINGIDNEISAV